MKGTIAFEEETAEAVGVPNGELVGFPSCIAQLISLCWAPDPEIRPVFGDIVSFLKNEAKAEIMGGTGLGRMPSANGTLAAPANEEASVISEKLAQQKERGGVKVAAQAVDAAEEKKKTHG